MVFGKSDTSAVELSDVALDTDNSGFVMNGACLYDHAGGSILLGDVNGDGLADITIGEVRRNVNNNFSSQDSDGDGSMTSFMLDESAGFTVTCPNFYAGANATVTDFRFQLDTSFPINIWEDYACGYDIDFSADEIDQTISIESGEHTENSSVSSDNPYRLEAVVNLEDWVDQSLAYPPTWDGVSIAFADTQEGCEENVQGYVNFDVYYNYGYTLWDSGLRANVDLFQNFTLELEPVATLTLEDNSEYIFSLDDGLRFTPESSADIDGDGIVTATLEININPVFTNDTALDGALHYDFQAGWLKVLKLL